MSFSNVCFERIVVYILVRNKRVVRQLVRAPQKTTPQQIELQEGSSNNTNNTNNTNTNGIIKETRQQTACTREKGQPPRDTTVVNQAYTLRGQK